MTIIIGDAKTELEKLESESVNCCVTSPPYFGLRDYGVDGQLGLEKTPDEYVENLVSVFREVKRVLRNDGTLWLNLGDSYIGNGTGSNKQGSSTLGGGKATQIEAIKRPNKKPCGALKQKDLIGIPWRVAFALQADGWYLRQDIIWHKPNPMPESVRDRCTKSHEYIFLLSKSPKYYYDHEAIKEPCVSGANGSKFNTGKTKTHQLGTMSDKPRKESLTRNKRSVWTVSTKPYKAAHFATFPPDLIEPCVLAGCPENGIVLDPFIGSGTVGMVAKQNNRAYIGIELNPEYKPLIDHRLKAGAGE